MTKTGKCLGCGAHRILRITELCKRCNATGAGAMPAVIEEEEVKEE